MFVASLTAENTVNPIRQIVDGMKLKPNPKKKAISLALGDPTLFKNFSLNSECVEQVVKVLQSGDYNGYTLSTGMETARKSLALFYSNSIGKLDASDVIITSGCSSALDLCVTVLCDPGKVIK